MEYYTNTFNKKQSRLFKALARLKNIPNCADLEQRIIARINKVQAHYEDYKYSKKGFLFMDNKSYSII